MNKIISIILTLAMLLSMSSFTVDASSEPLTITSPAHNSTITNVDTTIEVSNSSAYSEFVYEFDGITLADAKMTKDMLTIGEHTLKVYAFGADDSVASATSTFNVIKQLNDTTTVNFNNLDNQVNNTDATVNLYPYPFVSSATKKVQIVRKNAAISLVDGREKTSSNADVAIEVKNSGAATASSKAASFNVTFPAIASTAVFEHDIKISNTNSYIWYEMNCSQTYGATAKYFYVGGTAAASHHISDGGNFFGNSNYPCTAEKWYHLKTIIDFMSETVTVDVTDYETNLTTTVFKGAIMDTANKKNVVKDITSVKIQCRSSKASAITIDNIKLSEAPTFTGIKNFEYIYDTEASSDSNPDSSRLTGLKIYMNEPVVAAVPVTITDKSGYSIDISDTVIDKTTKTITATLPAGQLLSANTEYKVSVPLSVNLAGLSEKATKNFKTKADSYAADEPQFMIGEAPLLRKSMLCGNKLKVRLSIANADTPKPAAFVLAVRDGNKLVGLDIYIPSDGVVPATGADYTLETNPLPVSLTDVTTQVMYLNDINNISTAFATVTKTLD